MFLVRPFHNIAKHNFTREMNLTNIESCHHVS
jgi:hypothetical protein